MAILLIIASLVFPGAQDRNEQPVFEPADWVVLQVSTRYPRADAATVADTIAAPLEQQLNGISGLKHIVSESKNDGSYSARLLFAAGTDVKSAIELAEQRVALTVPILPEIVQKQRVTVKADDDKNERGKIEIALLDAQARDENKVSEWGKEVIKQLGKEGQIKQAIVFPAQEKEKALRIDIDRAKSARMGVGINQINEAVESAGKSPSIETLKAIKITSTAGLKVPLGALVAFRQIERPAGVCRVDLTPALLITAEIREGGRLDELAFKCVAIATAEMNRLKLEGYQVTELSAR